MKKQKAVKALLMLMIISMTSFLWNCSVTTDGGDPIVGGTDSLIILDEAGADSIADSTMVVFESMICGIETEEDVKNVDFSDVNVSFKEAVRLNPTNTTAQLGAAITEMLLINQSSAFDFLDSMSNAINNEDSSEAMPKAFSIYRAARMVPDVNLVKSAGLILAKSAANVEEFPRFSAIQDSLKTWVLPTLDYVIARLEAIEMVSSFSLSQTDPCATVESDTMEIDLGEIYLLNAGLRMLRSSINIITAYNFDIDEDGTYAWIDELDSISSLEGDNDSQLVMLSIKRVKYLLVDDADFMNLHATGKVQLKSAHTDLKTAVSKVQSSVTYIENETDDQYNDILKVSYIQEGDLDVSSNSSNGPNFLKGVNSISALLEVVKDIVSGPYTFTEDFDDNADTDDAELKVDITSLLSNPIQDLRVLLPKYKWLPEDEWIVITNDTDWYSETEYDVYENVDIIPVELVDAAGNSLSLEDDSLIYKVQLDWTAGGILPEMTSFDDYNDIFGIMIDDSNDSTSKMDKVLNVRPLF